MLSPQSFRSRLLLSFLLVIILALLLPAWYSRHILSLDALAERKSDAARQLSLVARLLGERVDLREQAALQPWLAEASERLRARLTLVSAEGMVVADNRPAVASFASDDPVSSPETRQSLADGDQQFLYAGPEVVAVACRIGSSGAGPGAGPEGVLRLAVPRAGADSRLNNLTGDFLLILGTTLSLAVVVSLFLARQLSTSIGAMISVAEAIGKGNYRQRLRLYPGREFDALARSINRMAESIETHIQTITYQKGQLEAILNGMREGVMVLDARGVIRAANPALAAIAPGPGPRGGHEGRRPLEAVMSPELQDGCDRVLSKADSPGTLSMQIELDTDRVYDVSIVRLSAESGLGAVVVFHDISELKRLERIRRDFVANVSHELRTPLTSIKGYAETLLGEAGNDSGALGSFLEIILRNANHMTKMVNDLLNLARLEAGQQPFRIRPVDAAAALATASRECAALAAGKSISLESRLPAGRVMVLADPDRLVQVFRNLLENAIKYSPAGRPVTVVCSEAGEDVTFGVRDMGPGIPRNEQLRIFERFYRIEKHRGKPGGTGSSGLGLAIARHIVERQGGRIWVESAPEADAGGATFYFTLPRDVSDAGPDNGIDAPARPEDAPEA